MNLELKAKHFKDVVFASICDCAVANAAQELFDTQWVMEGVTTINISTDEGSFNFLHDYYGEAMFKQDSTLAKMNNYDDTVIRTLTLTPE